MGSKSPSTYSFLFSNSLFLQEDQIFLPIASKSFTLVDPDKIQSNSAKIDLGNNLRLVIKGKFSSIRYLVCNPNTESVLTPVRLDFLIPFLRIYSNASYIVRAS